MSSCQMSKSQTPRLWRRHMGNGEHGHNFGHMGNGKHGQRGIMVNTVNRDGAPWGMGHMGDGVHGQWGTWA